jgi:hypothetical protein
MISRITVRRMHHLVKHPPRNPARRAVRESDVYEVPFAARGAKYFELFSEEGMVGVEKF